MAAADYNSVVQQLYVAYFGRPADPVGLANFTAQLNTIGAPTTMAGLNAAYSTNSTVKTLIDQFGSSAESAALYTGSTVAFVNAIYQNVLGRDADLEGLLFWSSAIDNGSLSRGKAAASIMAGALTNTSAQGLIDAQVVANKTTVAANFTAALDTAPEVVAYSGNTAAATARSMLATVSNTTDTTAFQSTVDSTVSQLLVVTAPTGSTFTLSTGIDIKTGTQGNDTFDGSVNAQGTATLTSVDVLDGAGGTGDTLIAEMTGSTIAPTVKNIESLEIIGGGSAASTFNMVNVSNSPTVLVRNSSQAVTIDSFSGNTITLRDQAANLNVNVTNASATGASTFTVNLSGAQKGGGNGPTIALTQMAGADISGIETVVVDSSGSNANFLTALTSQNGSGTSKIATLNVTGAQALTIATALDASVKTLDASATTGGVTASFAATGAATLTGGAGNDALTLTASAGNVSVTAGAGNDVISLTGGSFTKDDTIAGGDGTDRLDVIASDAEAVTAALTNTTGFEQLSLNTAGTASSSINATYFGTIDTVRLDKGTNGAYGVTMAAGTETLTVGSTNQTLGGTLTVTDTGTATTDALTISNRATTGNTNVLNGQSITDNGYETLTISTGSAATAAQTIATLAINADATNVANTIKVTGANALTITDISSNSSGVLTIDASGMTAQAAGTATFTNTNAPTFTGGVTGTVSIIGSEGDDALKGHATAANTIVGGAGADTITGGSAADNLSGGAGNDNITGGGGNDTLAGGDGNDTFTVAAGTVNVDGGAGNDTVNMSGTLSAGDTIVGGDGTDTLSINTAATASTATGVSGFETLTVDGNTTQDMVQFINNTGFTRVNFGSTAANTITISNASSSVATLGLADVALTGGTFTRLVDTSADSLAISALGMTAARTVTALSIANEETVTITTSTNAAGDLTITTLTADDMKSLTVSGAGDLIVTNSVANAANLATVNASAATGAVKLIADTSVVDMTITGSLSGANTLTGGTGADVITGGDVADSLTGGNGADTINGGAGADTLVGGLGNDVINGGIGDDVITGGAGNDVLTGGAGIDTFTFTAAATEGVDNITDFVTGTDKIDVTQTISDVTAAAGVQAALADAKSVYLSFNGAAANLTTAGAATLNVADMTATTLTNLATYLSERFTVANGVQNDVLVINWTAGNNDTSYVYNLTTAAGNTAIDAAELTLIGVVHHTAGTVMAAGDLI